jgi:3-phenylpropionate/trans-cinnamate dioxygenase ferredoxin reductase component
MSTEMRRTLVIVGAGLAGDKAAVAARTTGFDGRIVLFGDEPDPPYERPPLSKQVLRNESAPDVAFLHEVADYTAYDIELRTGHAVTGLDRDRHLVQLADGETQPYTTAILATGSEPRRLPVPGGHLDGIHHLRTIRDAVSLRDAISGCRRVAVVGAGWIGCEVAASARQVGAEVTLIDPSPAPLHRTLGPVIGKVFADLHRDHGVDLRLGATVDGLLGKHTVEGVELRDGPVVEADAVVVGIGVTPRTALARSAGLEVDNGVVVDEHLRSSDPDVFAAGDIASAWHPLLGRRIRVEHWATALHQGEAAGRNAAGAAIVYDRLPYFYSDQYDLGLEYVGHHGPGDVVRIDGSVAERQFVAYWERPDGVLTAAMAVNVWDVIEDLKLAVLHGRLPAAS